MDDWSNQYEEEICNTGNFIIWVIFIMLKRIDIFEQFRNYRNSRFRKKNGPQPSRTTENNYDIIGTETVFHNTIGSKEGFFNSSFKDDWERVFEIRSSCIDFDIDNQIWSRFDSLKYFNGDKWSIIDTPNEFDMVRGCPHIVSEGRIAFYSNFYRLSENIAVLDENGWSFIGFPDIEGKYLMDTTNLKNGNNDDYWLGLAKCSPSGSCLYHYYYEQWHEIDIPVRSIHPIVIDDDNNVWIGGDDKDGLAVYDGDIWNFYSTEQLFNIVIDENSPSTYLKLTKSKADSILGYIRGYHELGTCQC